MKPAPFVYHDPGSVSEAITLLSDLENARILAGGQSLMQDLNARLATPGHLVDLRRIPDLDQIREEADGLFVGAMARQRDVQLSSVVKRNCPLLCEALSHVGHLQTRNRGTIGGSFAYLHPTAEMLAAGIALDVVLHVERRDGRVDVPIDNLAVDYMKTSLSHDDLLIGATFQIWPADHGYAFVEFAPRHGTYALVSVAALLDLSSDGTIDRVALGVTGIASGPVRLQSVEERLSGNRANGETFQEAASLAQQVEARDDVGASADYRRRLTGVLTHRALDLALSRASERNGHA